MRRDHERMPSFRNSLPAPSRNKTKYKGILKNSVKMTLRWDHVQKGSSKRPAEFLDGDERNPTLTDEGIMARQQIRRRGR